MFLLIKKNFWQRKMTGHTTHFTSETKDIGAAGCWLLVSHLQGTGESDRCKSRSANGLGAQWRAQPWLPPVNPVSWCLWGLLLTGKSTNWESQRGFIRLWSGLIYLQVKIIADDHQESPSWGSVPLSQCVTVRYSGCAFQNQESTDWCGEQFCSIRVWQCATTVMSSGVLISCCLQS